MKRVLRWVLAVALALLAGTAGAQSMAKAAGESDYADLWWTPGEAGWGLQIVHQAQVLFATIYVYDAGGQPTFYTATLDPASAGTWSGALYRSTGPYFGSAFGASQIGYRSVGTMSFAPSTSIAARLVYSVDGVTVDKPIERLLLRNEDFTGEYVVIAHVGMAGCGDDIETFGIGAWMITHSGGSFAFSIVDENGQETCRFNGPYVQSGRLGRAAGTLACDDGSITSATYYDMTTNETGMITGRMRASSSSLPGCVLEGHFNGIRVD